MNHRTSVRLAVALCCLAGIPWAACSELMPNRSPGEKLYRQRCARCHGLDARGNTPNYVSDASTDLTDDRWIHGSGDEAMAHVIQYGVLGRMPENPDLSPEEIRQIVEHVNQLLEDARQFD